MRAALAAALVLAAVTGVPARATPGRLADVLYVAASDTRPATTRFATDPERSYRVTVSGAWFYNGTNLGQQDCGHVDTPDEDGWIPADAPRVDGKRAPCVDMPYDETHTYEWTQPGTGRPLSFVVPYQDPALYADDVGGLTVVVAELR